LPTTARITCGKLLQGFRSITIEPSSANKGLANSITYGVSKVLEKHDRIIVLEDDLLTSPYFLSFLNQGLELYQHDDRVASVCSYVYPVNEPLPETFFLKNIDSLGWATWSRAWKIFNPDGATMLKEIKKKNLAREFNFNNAYAFLRMLHFQSRGIVDSWAIRWYASVFLQDKLSLFTGSPFVKNIGFDESGSNSSAWDKQRYDTVLELKEPRLTKIEVKENKEVRVIFERYLKRTRKPLMIKIGDKFRKLLRNLKG
jgi:hypothetical protein